MLAEELAALESKFRSVNPMGGTRLLGDWTVRIDGGPGRWAPAPVCCWHRSACLAQLTWPRQLPSCFCVIMAAERIPSSAKMAWAVTQACPWLCSLAEQALMPQALGQQEGSSIPPWHSHVTVLLQTHKHLAAIVTVPMQWHMEGITTLP